MKKWVKLLSLILALAIVASIAAGCGKKKDEEETTDDAAEGNYVDLSSGFTDVKVMDEQSALAAVESASDSLDMGDTNYALNVTDVSKFDGETYYRMQQTINGVPVYGREVILVADSSGNAVSLTSNMAKISDANEAKDASGIDYTKLRDKAMAILESDDYSVSDLKCVTKPETVYYANESGVARACYKDVISFKVDDTKSYEVQVLFDCDTYEFVDFDLVSTYVGSSVSASGKDTLGQDRSFTAYKEDGTYYLYDEDKDIMVVNAQGNTVDRYIAIIDENGVQYIYNNGKLYDESGNEYTLSDDDSQIMDSSGKVVASDLTIGFKFGAHPDNNGLVVSSSSSSTWNDAKAVSAVSRVTTTYDFYKDILGRDSFNDEGAPIRVFYDDGLDGVTNNAYSCTMPDMTMLTFGTEIEIEYDVVGHEFTHSVVGSVVDLPYRNQPGAINEAYADIFGEIVEDYADGKLDNSCNWQTSSFRDHIDPVSAGYPAEYKGKNWYPNVGLPEVLASGVLGYLDQIIDHGGVHTNSTVLSHAAYLMNTGIDGDAGKKIGTELLGKIWYKALFSIHSDESFPELAKHVYEAASRTNGVSSAQLECIKEAFAQVGLEV